MERPQQAARINQRQYSSVETPESLSAPGFSFLWIALPEGEGIAGFLPWKDLDADTRMRGYQTGNDGGSGPRPDSGSPWRMRKKFTRICKSPGRGSRPAT